MSAIYDNWEKLVDAVLKKEQLWQLFHSDSVSVSSDSSSFSFSCLTSSLDDVPFAFPKQDAKSLPSILVEEPIKNATSKPARKRNLRIEVPEIRFEDVSFGTECRREVSPRKAIPGFSPRGAGIYSKPETKQQSYPLPLPPGAVWKWPPVSPTLSAAKSPSASPRSLEGAEGISTHWKKGKLIGRGPLGNVYLGFNSEKGEMCAMKEVRLSDVDMKRGAQMLEREILLLSRMKHPNIVQYFGSEMVGDNLYIYLEYISGGSIHAILQEYGKLGESAIRNYTQKILAGLAYLHSKNTVHGNIKATSILVDPNVTVKLSNFIIEKHIASQSNPSFLMDSHWIAPEVIMNSNVRNSASDIWSLGCTVLEMATSKPPLSHYNGVMAMFKVSCQNELPTIPDHLSDVCKDFLRCCLQLNPIHRATALKLLEHPFVKSSSPLGKQILASTSSSSGHLVVTNAVKPEGSNFARSPRVLDSGKVALHSSNSKASKSSFKSKNNYTPTSTLSPISPLGSPVLLPVPTSPHQLKRDTSPRLPISSPSTAMVGEFGLIQPPHQRQERDTLPKQSMMSSSPSYWDPNIIRAVFKFS